MIVNLIRSITKKIDRIKLLFIFSSILFPTISLANESINARADIISSIYSLTTIFATLMGLGLLVVGVIKLKKRGDNPNDPKAFPATIIMTILAGALAFNYATSASLIITSLLVDSEAGYCFVIEDAEVSGIKTDDKCWDSSKSEILGDIEAKVNSMSDNNIGTEIKENATNIIALFQTIGLIYFLKGLYGLKVTSEGQSRDGYGKPIITIISAALIIDLPHTIEMIKETINYMGFGV